MKDESPKGILSVEEAVAKYSSSVFGEDVAVPTELTPEYHEKLEAKVDEAISRIATEHPLCATVIRNNHKQRQLDCAPEYISDETKQRDLLLATAHASYLVGLAADEEALKKEIASKLQTAHREATFRRADFGELAEPTVETLLDISNERQRTELLEKLYEKDYYDRYLELIKRAAVEVGVEYDSNAPLFPQTKEVR